MNLVVNGRFRWEGGMINNVKRFNVTTSYSWTIMSLSIDGVSEHATGEIPDND